MSRWLLQSEAGKRASDATWRLGGFREMNLSPTLLLDHIPSTRPSPRRDVTHPQSILHPYPAIPSGGSAAQRCVGVGCTAARRGTVRTCSRRVPGLPYCIGVQVTWQNLGTVIWDEVRIGKSSGMSGYAMYFLDRMI